MEMSVKNLALIAFAVAGLATAAAPALAEEILSKDQFLEQIAGKKLVDKNSWVLLSPDGKVSGRGPGDGEIVGHWTWSGRFYCRDIVIDNVAWPHDCQVVTREGDSVAFTHKEGAGISEVWTIE